jgi:hypothetical protein
MKQHSKLRKAAGGFVVASAIAAACQPLKKPAEQPLPSSIVEEFGASVKICTTNVVMQEVGAAESNGLKPAKVEVQLGICGNMGDDPALEWKAIGAAVLTDSVRLSGKYGENAGESEAKLYVDDQGQLIAVRGDAQHRLGKFNAIETYERLDTNGGGQFQIMVGSEPFAVDRHTKQSEGMNVWVR